MPLSLTIVTPRKTVVKNLSADALVMPAAKGEVTILPGHTPLLTTLGVGVIRTLSHAENINFLVTGGFAEVRNDQVLILGEKIEAATEIDLERAEKAKAEVEQTVLNTVLGELEYAKYMKKLERTQKRVEMAKFLKGIAETKKKG